MESALTSKGQATIPKAVREHLGLKAGDRIRFFLRREGGVTILPVIPASRLAGIVKYGGPPLSIEDMDDAIAEGALESAGLGPNSKLAAE